MEIKEVHSNKKDFLDILLIGDEEEAMIDKYLDKGLLIALYDNNKLRSVCVVAEVDCYTIEIKNLATYPHYQKQGYATKLLDYVFNKYRTKNLILGTGENEETLQFYKKRGFRESHRVENFFVENYSKPIYENQKQLIDMIYLMKKL